MTTNQLTCLSDLIIAITNTVKPVFSGHPLGMAKWPLTVKYRSEKFLIMHTWHKILFNELKTYLFIQGGRGTPISRLYRYEPLWRVEFSNSLLCMRWDIEIKEFGLEYGINLKGHRTKFWIIYFKLIISLRFNTLKIISKTTFLQSLSSVSWATIVSWLDSF